MEGTLRSQPISIRLQQIAEQAASYPERVFTSLAHLIDVDFLRVAFDKTRKDAAAGIDGVTAKDYAESLEENLENLHERLQTGKYRATPVKRVWLEKDDGKQRPLGILILEDKIVQRAGTMLLSAIYEQDFYDFSKGFRAGRSPHQALQELREMCRLNNTNWVVDADIVGFFDNIDRGLLREIIKQRVNDGGLLRLIGKWLNAGVLEGKELSYPEAGTPQGGVISPLLANIFLHHVLDEWFEKEIKPLLKGRCFIIRFADDFVIGCELESDARRIMDVLPKRFNRFKLTIHPEKTSLVEFRNPDRRKGRENGKYSFDFLGFTHYWAKSRRGFWVIKRKTMRKRLRRKLKEYWFWCRNNKHERIKEQYRKLRQKLLGYYQYYGIIGNYKMLEVVLEYVEKAWRHWLGRRTRNGYISYEKFNKIKETFPLPMPRIVHSI